jgi:DNA polymerase (family 10)
MDSRTAAHVLSQIAAYLELKGESSFKCRAYAGAAQGVLALRADDLGPLYRSGELSAIRGLGPATLAVVRDLIETGESRYLEQLRESTPEGLLDMLDVPGLSPLKIHQIHEGLGIESVEELEAAANDGRLGTLPKFGPKTIAKILKGIASARERGPLQLYHHARVEAQRLLASITSHPDVVRAEVAGAIRRCAEVASSVDIVAACARNPTDVAQSFTRLSGIKSAEGDGPFVSIRFVDGAELELHCVDTDRFTLALWRATGTNAHVDAVQAALASNNVTIDDDRLRDGGGAVVATPGESAIYAAASLAFVEPELREGLGKVDAARRGTLPTLVSMADIRGVLHCHSHYSDGKASIGELAQAASERGWSYIGITDHSQAAFFAGGLSREAVRAQRDEIDELNATLDNFRVLKGIEADILAGGHLDYGDELLDEFDFVVGAIHSRFSMDRATMTDRVLRALDDPRLTILAHPTGRLLLTREPYAIDLGAVLEKAAALGVALELNADPRRLDLDWRHLHTAKRLGATVAIGPDAHSTRGLDNMEIGVGIARKGWLERGDVLNARSANDVVAFARARRTRAS